MMATGWITDFRKIQFENEPQKKKIQLLHFPNNFAHCTSGSWHTPSKQQAVLLLHGSKSADFTSGTQAVEDPLQYSGKSHGSVIFLHKRPLSAICETKKNQYFFKVVNQKCKKT